MQSLGCKLYISLFSAYLLADFHKGHCEHLLHTINKGCARKKNLSGSLVFIHIDLCMRYADSNDDDLSALQEHTSEARQ